jgi:hypothetical protein
MTALPLTPFTIKASHWVLAVAVGGIAWNLFGAVQFANSISATTESLVASGLTPQQAAVMTGHPAWMTLAFGLGVGGGLVGSVLLLLRHRAAAGVLAASLAAYVALWIGDWVHGVFAAMGAQQVIILTLVVAIAAALYAASRHPAARR